MLKLEIFDEAAVAQAIIDFGQIATIDAFRESDYIICTFRNCTYDEDLTMHEFENYLIDLMNSLAK